MTSAKSSESIGITFDRFSGLLSRDFGDFLHSTASCFLNHFAALVPGEGFV
jgi:hypothetical protein